MLNIFKQFSFIDQVWYIISILSYKLLSIVPKKVINTKRATEKIIENGGEFISKSRTESYVHLKRDELKLKFLIRKKSSDLNVFETVFLNNQYEPLIRLAKLFDTKEPRVVIDAGANIGASSIYFKTKFPTSIVVAIEPDKQNFNYLEENCSLNESELIAINKPIWGHKTTLSVNLGFRDGSESAISFEQAEKGQGEPSITLSEIIAVNNFDSLDILKIDIEGAEKSIFENRKEYEFVFSKTRILAIEIHPEIISYSESYRILKDCGFVLYDNYDMMVGINKNLLVQN